MIVSWIINLFSEIISTLISVFPVVTELPLGMGTAISTAIGLFRAFMALFPPIEIVFTAFLWYLGFRIALLVTKLILGSRVPVHH